MSFTLPFYYSGSNAGSLIDAFFVFLAVLSAYWIVKFIVSLLTGG